MDKSRLRKDIQLRSQETLSRPVEKTKTEPSIRDRLEVVAEDSDD